MKKFVNFSILFLTFIMLFDNNFSQSSNVNLTWGDDYKGKKGNLYNIVYDNNNYYGLRGPNIESYDKKLNLISSTKFKVSRKKDNYLSFILINNVLTYIYYYKDYKNDEFIIEYVTFDKNTLKSNNDEKILKKFTFGHKNKYPNINLIKSEDNTKMLIYYDKTNKKKENEEISLHVLDNSMNELWSKDITMKYIEKLYVRKDISIDNNAKVYLLGKKYEDKLKEKNKDREANYNFIINEYDNNNENEIIIESKNFLSNMTLSINYDDIYCVGLYGEKNSFSNIGYYYFKIDKNTRKIKLENYNKFSDEVFTSNLKSKELKRVEKVKKKAERKGKDLAIINYEIDNIIEKEDGGLVFVAEKRYVVAHTSYDSKGVMKTYYTYVYGPILVLSVDKNGNEEWARSIIKRAEYDIEISKDYSLTISNDKLYFFYLDNEDNLDEDTKRHKSSHSISKQIASIADININGELNKNILFRTKEMDVKLVPRSTIQLENDDVIIYSYKGKKQKLGKITF